MIIWRHRWLGDVVLKDQADSDSLRERYKKGQNIKNYFFRLFRLLHFIVSYMSELEKAGVNKFL